MIPPNFEVTIRRRERTADLDSLRCIRRLTKPPVRMPTLKARLMPRPKLETTERRTLPRWVYRTAAAVLSLGASVVMTPASAQRIENGRAVFAALDKVTARISKLEVKLGETVQFGQLKVTPRACYTRAPTEPPKTTTFVEIEEIQLDGKTEKIFAGWMFAESPGLNAVEHPVFDVWLTDCTTPTRPAVAQTPSARAGRPPIPGTAGTVGTAVPPEPLEADPAEQRRSRPRR